MNKALFLTAFALATLTGCSSSDEPVADSSNSPVSFSASIYGTATRAYDQTWESGDKIGISCTTGDKTYTNVAYSTAGTGDFTAVTSGSEIYYQSAATVTFTAYYPWTDFTTGTTAITANTWNQSSQKSFDYLHAQTNGSKANPDVAFVFSHKMAKLVLTVKRGADVSYNEIKQAVLSLAGFKNNGSFDTATGQATASGDASAAWSFANSGTTAHNAPVKYNNTEETVTYTLILFPQEFTDALPLTAATPIQSFATALDFTTANNAAGDTSAKNEWVAGRQYNMSVTLHKTALTVNGCTITAWDEANGGNFDAK